jgi:FKBP-type peptidyl-prolyl cis-trans isomerase 2
MTEERPVEFATALAISAKVTYVQHFFTILQEVVMSIAQGSKVAIEYTLTLGDDRVVDTNVGGQPLQYTQGAGQIIVGLERALEGKKQGDSVQVEVAPEHGYGPVVQEAIIEVSKEELPENARQVGLQVQGQTPDGQKVQAQVVEMGEETAVLDFNHPLAGKTLHFDVKILQVQ